MRYYLDTEFNGFGGELLSLAIVREDRESLYLVYPEPARVEPWVAANVIPILWSIPSPMPGMPHRVMRADEGAALIAGFLDGDEDPIIVTDWPDDIAYFCKAVITAPGYMAPIKRLKFDLRRVDAYPTTLPGAIQHNAWWDAMALRHLMTGQPASKAAAPASQPSREEQ